jgi:hypothetical protein
MMRLDVGIEHEDERAVRLGSARRAKWLADIKGAILFLVVLAGLIAVALIAARIAFFDAGVAPEVRRWAETVLTALVSGGLSYLIGRAIGGSH